MEKQESFNTLTAVINTSQHLSKIENSLEVPAHTWQAQTHLQDKIKLEVLQLRLASKPLEVIKKNIENMTQW